MKQLYLLAIAAITIACTNEPITDLSQLKVGTNISAYTLNKTDFDVTPNVLWSKKLLTTTYLSHKDTDISRYHFGKFRLQPVANAIRIDVREGKIVSIKMRIAIDQIFELRDWLIATYGNNYDDDFFEHGRYYYTAKELEIFEKLFPGYTLEEDPNDPNYAKCIIVLSDYFLWRTPEASYTWDINRQETLLNTLTITAK